MASSSKKQDEALEAALMAPRGMKRAATPEGAARLQAVVTAVSQGKPEEAPEVPDAIAPRAETTAAEIAAETTEVVRAEDGAEPGKLFTEAGAKHLVDVATGRAEPVTEGGQALAPAKEQKTKRVRKPKGEQANAQDIVISQDRKATQPGTKRNPRQLKTQPRATRFTTIHFNDLTLKWLELAKGLTGRTMASITDEAVQRYLASVPGMPGRELVKQLMKAERKAAEKGQ